MKLFKIYAVFFICVNIETCCLTNGSIKISPGWVILVLNMKLFDLSLPQLWLDVCPLWIETVKTIHIIILLCGNIEMNQIKYGYITISLGWVVLVPLKCYQTWSYLIWVCCISGWMIFLYEMKLLKVCGYIEMSQIKNGSVKISPG